jgi:hypothetical protein
MASFGATPASDMGPSTAVADNTFLPLSENPLPTEAFDRTFRVQSEKNARSTPRSTRYAVPLSVSESCGLRAIGKDIMSTETPKLTRKNASACSAKVPRSVQTLRASYKYRLRILDGEAFKAELTGESDGSCVILVSALIEDALTHRIVRSFSIKSDAAELRAIFRPEGPLGTFSSRMEIACLFGIIGDAAYAQLDLVREYLRSHEALRHFRRRYFEECCKEVVCTAWNASGAR